MEEPTSLLTSGELKSSDVHREIQVLASKLSRIHGMITVSRESGGMHIYMASPKCLEQQGEVELTKRHLAINVDRYLGLGTFRNRKGTYNPDWSALCMKTDTLTRYRPAKDGPQDKRGQPKESFRARNRVPFSIPACKHAPCIAG